MRFTKPTWKQKAMMIIILLSLISFVVVSTHDNVTLHKRTNTRDRFDTIFKHIPKLFQHLIEVLDEKPEILERNDATVFKRDVNHDTSISNSGNDNMNSDDDKDLKKNTEDEGYSTKITFEEDINEFQVDISDDFYEYIGDPGEENKTDQRTTIYRSEEFEDSTFLGALGLDSFKLAPEEIYTNSVKVEEMLEDYNSSR